MTPAQESALIASFRDDPDNWTDARATLAAVHRFLVRQRAICGHRPRCNCAFCIDVLGSVELALEAWDEGQRACVPMVEQCCCPVMDGSESEERIHRCGR